MTIEYNMRSIGLVQLDRKEKLTPFKRSWGNNKIVCVRIHVRAGLGGPVSKATLLTHLF